MMKLLLVAILALCVASSVNGLSTQVQTASGPVIGVDEGAYIVWKGMASVIRSVASISHVFFIFLTVFFLYRHPILGSEQIWTASGPGKLDVSVVGHTVWSLLPSAQLQPTVC